MDGAIAVRFSLCRWQQHNDPNEGCVVHVVRDQMLAGSQRIALSILCAPELSGCRRVLICGEPTGDSSEFRRLVAENGIELIHLANFDRSVGCADIRLLLTFFRTFTKLRPILCHMHSAKPFVLGGTAAFFARVPIRIYTVHGVSFHADADPTFRRIAYLLERFAVHLYTTVTSVNRHYATMFGRAGERFRIIQNGVPEPIESSDPQDLPDDVINVLFAGRIDEVKDPLFALDVIEYITSSTCIEKRFHFTFAGDGPLMDQLVDEVARRGLSERIEILGWIHDLTHYYKRADVLFLPSRREAFGLVILEAGSYGCPVVATRVEGIPEVVQDGKNGHLFDLGDVKGAADALCAVVASSEHYRMLSEGALRAARSCTEQNMTDEYLRLYGEYLEYIGQPLISSHG